MYFSIHTRPARLVETTEFGKANKLLSRARGLDNKEMAPKGSIINRAVSIKSGVRAASESKKIVEKKGAVKPQQSSAYRRNTSSSSFLSYYSPALDDVPKVVG